MPMPLLSSPLPTSLLPTPSSSKLHLPLKPHFSPSLLFSFRKPHYSLLARASAGDNGSGVVGSAAAAAAVVEEKAKEGPVLPAGAPEVEKETSGGSNGAAAVGDLKAEVAPPDVPRFKDPRWVGGTWDLAQFEKDGKTDWDAVIEAEARRRKWLQDTPEESSNDEPVVFDTSVIPWWAWIKRYHLPEAELLNGRAAMIGFFMAYFVDSLTGIGLVDQMGNFFCKTLLFIAVVGVLVIRKNEDIETVKKLIEETTFYDKQWQATWKDDPPNDQNN